MAKKKIIVIGGGGHAKVIISILKNLNCYKIIGYSDICDKGEVLGIPFLGDDDYIINNFDNNIKLCLAIGQIKNIEKREAIISKFKNKDYNFEKIIAPSAIVKEDLTIGDGTVIMDGVVINSGTEIGDYSIINTSSSIDHDCKLGDFVHIAPGAVLCGEVVVGSKTFVGAGSIIINNKIVGSNVFVGAGSLVNKNVSSNMTAIGVPIKCH